MSDTGNIRPQDRAAVDKGETDERRLNDLASADDYEAGAEDIQPEGPDAAGPEDETRETGKDERSASALVKDAFLKR